MTSNDKTHGFKDERTMLSTLWVFLTVNYIYCDVFTLMNPEDLKHIIAGGVGSLQITQGFLLAFAIVMEIPLAMIVLSRMLKYGVNRWANIIAGIIMTAVQIWSLFFGGSLPTFHYLFFSAVEISCTLIIIALSWKWKSPDIAL
jgi:hypothetical protein